MRFWNHSVTNCVQPILWIKSTDGHVKSFFDFIWLVHLYMLQQRISETSSNDRKETQYFVCSIWRNMQNIMFFPFYNSLCVYDEHIRRLILFVQGRIHKDAITTIQIKIFVNFDIPVECILSVWGWGWVSLAKPRRVSTLLKVLIRWF
jgi:hypothetical protein